MARFDTMQGYRNSAVSGCEAAHTWVVFLDMVYEWGGRDHRGRSPTTGGNSRKIERPAAGDGSGSVQVLINLARAIG